jgi:hypothetical protein
VSRAEGGGVAMRKVENDLGEAEVRDAWRGTRGLPLA